MVGILLSFWEGLFSGAMLNFGRVVFGDVLFFSFFFLKVFTLPETNIAPEKGWLEYYFPFGKAYFQELC